MSASMSTCCRRVFSQNFIKECGKRYMAMQWVTSRKKPKPLLLRNLEQEFKDNPKEKRETIIIPKKKKRDELSILRALASTVGKDVTAPHYKYIDDPHLIPATNMTKKSFALAKESGRNAARYLASEYHYHLNYNTAEPYVEAFMPKPDVYAHIEATEEALIERIDKKRISDAYAVYKALKTNGDEIALSSHLQLLDLLCVYNSCDSTPSFTVAEYWFHSSFENRDAKRLGQAWNVNGPAELVFEDLPEKTPSAYCSLIRGMCKFQQPEKAYQIYAQMVDEKIPVDLSTYHALLRVTAWDRQLTYDGKWHQTLQGLQDIRAAGFSPTLHTFNSALYMLSRMPRYKRSLAFAMQIIAEMKQCNIEPSLASWYYITHLAYPFENSQSPVLYQILDYLEGREFTFEHPDDGMFFPIAMTKCFYNIQDLDLIYKIDSLLQMGNNMQFLTDASKEGMYYVNFFRMVCMLDDMDNIMSVYERIVPHMWTPTISAMCDLFSAVELHDAHHYLPSIWSDIMMFNFGNREEVMCPFLALMARKQHTDDKLKKDYASVVEKMLSVWTTQHEADMRKTVLLTGPVIGDMITISLNADRADLAWSAFELYQKETRHFAGFPSELSTFTLLQHCVEQEEVKKALLCLETMSELAFSKTTEATDLIRDKLQLTETENNEIDSLSL